MPGLYGIISSSPLSKNRIIKRLNNGVCDSIGSKFDRHYISKDRRLLIGVKTYAESAIKDHFLELDDLVIYLSGWIDLPVGTKFTDHIVKIYSKYGSTFCKYLKGNFCITLWDNHRDQLIISSDHFGLRPHYYNRSNSTFSFAYEVGPLITLNKLSSALDLRTLSQFISYEYILQDNTWHPDIKLLPPATSVIADKQGKIKFNKYWDWTDIDNTLFEGSNQIDAIQNCRYLFNQAIEKCYQNTKDKVLITLSGGLDTRALISGAKLDRTETITHGLPNCANRVIGKMIADHIGVEHHEFDIEPRWLPETCEKIVWLTSGHESIRHTHSHSYHNQFNNFMNRVIIGGLGGEYVRAFFYNFGKVAEICDLILSNNNLLHANHLSKLLHVRMNYKGLTKIQKNKLIKREYSRRLEHEDIESIVEILNGYQSEKNVLKQLDRFYLDQRVRRFIINGQLYTWEHLEPRWPFMDFDFITASNELSSKIKVGSRFHRYLIKNNSSALMDIPLDADLKPISSNPQKLYYLKKFLPLKPDYAKYSKYTDYQNWFQKDCKLWIEDLILGKETLCHEYFNKDEIRNIWQDHNNGINKEKILSILLTIESWLKIQKKLET